MKLNTLSSKWSKSKKRLGRGIGSSNPYNLINACLEGLKKQSSPKTVSENRGKKISEIIKKKK